MARLENGYPFDSELFSAEGDVPLVRIRDLTADTFETFVPAPVSPRVMLQDGDIVIGMDGDFNAVRWGRGPAALNQRLCRLRPAPGSDIRFVEYTLPTPLKWINEAQYATTVKHLSSGEVLAARIPCPPYEEQRRIADFLDDQVARIDNIITARRRQSSAIREAIREAIASGVEADASAYGWIPLRRWVTAVDQGWSPQCDSVPAGQGEPGVLKLSAVRDGRFDPTENKAMLPESEPDARYLVRAGDLLMSRANTPELVGDSAVVSGECRDLYLPDLLYRVALSINEPSYVCGALRTPRVRGLLRVIGRGTSLSMAKMRGEDIRALPVPAAPPAVRVQRAHEFDLAERDSMEGIARLALSIGRLAELKRSLITAAVTGEFDVSAADGSRAQA
jgi:type I restriction enzyme S subunit